jgi:hypothetical protein
MRVHVAAPRAVQSAAPAGTVSRLSRLRVSALWPQAGRGGAAGGPGGAVALCRGGPVRAALLQLAGFAVVACDGRNMAAPATRAWPSQSASPDAQPPTVWRSVAAVAR